MKRHTVKHGRYTSRATRYAEGGKALVSDEALRAAFTRLATPQPFGELLDNAEALAQRALKSARKRHPAPAVVADGAKLKGDPVGPFAASLLSRVRALRRSMAAANSGREQQEKIAENALRLGYAWAQLATNMANADETKTGRQAQRGKLTERQQALRTWLAENGLTAARLKYASDDRTRARNAWAGERKRGTSESTFNRDVQALIDADY